MSDSTAQYAAFELRADLADPDAGFDYGVQIALPDGSTFKVGEALLEGDGVIVTADPRKKDSLTAWGAVEAVALPDDFEAPADPADNGPTLTELRARAGELDISGRSSMSKDDLAAAIADAEAQAEVAGEGDSGDGGSSDDTTEED